MADKDRQHHWCFTLNNPRSAEYVKIRLSAHLDARYWIYQMERGEQDTLHAQGYVEFTKAMRLGAVRQLFSGAHWESRRGTRDEARDYCRKVDRVDGPWEGGTWKEYKRGRRSDLIRLREAAQEGRSEQSVADDDELTSVWFKYYKPFERYKRICAGDRTWKTRVILYRGESGAGKSKRALAEYPGAYWQNRQQWWCGYEGQNVVVLDDYDGWLPIATFLRLLDRYPMMVETKGGQAAFTAKTIVITTNQPICEWYPKAREERQFAIKRRIDEEWEFYRGCDAVQLMGFPTAIEELAAAATHEWPSPSPPPQKEKECTECEEEACDCQGPV